MHRNRIMMGVDWFVYLPIRARKSIGTCSSSTRALHNKGVRRFAAALVNWISLDLDC